MEEGKREEDAERERGIERGSMDGGRERRGSEGCIDGRIHFELTWNTNNLEGGVESSFCYGVIGPELYSSLLAARLDGK